MNARDTIKKVARVDLAGELHDPQATEDISPPRFWKLAGEELPEEDSVAGKENVDAITCDFLLLEGVPLCRRLRDKIPVSAQRSRGSPASVSVPATACRFPRERKCLEFCFNALPDHRKSVVGDLAAPGAVPELVCELITREPGMFGKSPEIVSPLRIRKETGCRRKGNLALGRFALPRGEELEIPTETEKKLFLCSYFKVTSCGLSLILSFWCVFVNISGVTQIAERIC